MRIKIMDRPVQQNIELFLMVMRRMKEKQLKAAMPGEKGFNAWLNRKTGQLYFDGAEEKEHTINEKEWKPILLSYYYDSVSGEVQFSVQETAGDQKVFHRDDVVPDAFRILSDTMKVFNQITQMLKGPSDLDTKIAVLNKLSIVTEPSQIDHNVLIDAWHHVDRMQAESLLMEKPIGTYLFRKDSYAEILERELERDLRKKVKCFTLTFSQKDNQVSDYTLVHCDGKWQIYNDDPSLRQKSYSELGDLLGTLKNVLKFPLFH